MWMVEDALEHRFSIGQSRGSHADEEWVVRLSGKRFYQLQKLLEELAAAGGDFFRARIAVMLWEELRHGIVMKAGGDPIREAPGDE
jgi:hypothetical protein